MNDIDQLLSLVENPTRRRILESLVREPSYPLRLSKELGISQQAVMKNLTLMERNGLICSSRVDSNMGPTRIVYAPNSEFTLVIEMGSGRFTTRVTAPLREAAENPEIDTALIRERIEEIDRSMEYLEKKRSALMEERETLTRVLKTSKSGGNGQNIKSTERR